MNMGRKIRVGAVNYLNTKPLVYGFEQGLMKDDIELINDYPSRIASMLINEEIDIGLVPVAIIPLLKEYFIITDYCIGSDGEVASVCLFSEVPIEQIETVLLDYQSRTSVALAKILLKEFWMINPALVDTNEDFRKQITRKTAGLVIGDRALEQRKFSPFVYDLGKAWKELTGLPFVFAAWISNKKLDEGFIQIFNHCNKLGLQSIDQVVEKNPYTVFDLKRYYTHYLKYNLDDSMRRGMECFIKKVRELQDK
jgi:chorismate dehydratase